MIAAFTMGVGVAANGQVKVHGPRQKLKSGAQDADDLIGRAIQNDGLADNIRDIGLLHPISISADGALLAGQRRLEACKLLGWTEIAVTVVEEKRP